MTRIGVYICHCGSNIASKVDCAQVAETASTWPDVVVARDYKYMCSGPGRDLIVQDIKEHNLDRVVVASCSPRMHEPTFRRFVREGGLNGYLLEMANIREHVSWVTDDKEKATHKATALVHAAVRRVRHHEELFENETEIKPSALVIGGGIAGIEAALKISRGGRHVYLVEKEPSIGGHMAMLDKTFPTLDCSACILTPKMVEVAQDPNITLWTYSEVEKIDGFIGNFEVTVRRKQCGAKPGTSMRTSARVAAPAWKSAPAGHQTSLSRDWWNAQPSIDHSPRPFLTCRLSTARLAGTTPARPSARSVLDSARPTQSPLTTRIRLRRSTWER